MKLSVKQAAQRAGVSPALLYRWCEERRLPHYRLGGQGRRGRIQIEEADLDAFLESCKVEAGALRPEFRFNHRRH
jgi:excisionase family DNA binding protein